MKTLKNKTRYSRAAMTALLLCLAVSGAYAQTLITPSGSDVTWYPVSNNILGLNIAMIDGNNTTQIFGFVYEDGTASNSGFMISDASLGNTSFVSLSSAPTGIPDIAIGNNSAVSYNDYTVAVAYANSSNEIQVDLYNLYDDGSSISTPTFTCSLTSTATNNVSTVHIDVIADYNAIGPNPNFYPTCEYAVVTWDDLTTGRVYASKIDLYATSSGALPGITNISTGKTPDVAAIKRTTTDEVALITYTDATGGTLYYREWDITGITVGAATTLDFSTGTAPITVTIPRIDAIDDYTINAIAGATTAVYKVVAQVDNGITTHNEIRTYDNLLTGTATPYWTSSGVVDFSAILPLYPSPSAYDHYVPTVALGGPRVSMSYPFDASQYMVSHFTDDGSNDDILFMEPIDYSASTTLASPPDYYYWVSQKPPASTPPASYNYSNAVASACNNTPACGLEAWAYPWQGSKAIFYRFTPYPYSFRPGATAVTNVQADAWQVYPNPATDALTIKCTGAANAAVEYHITDMEGRATLQGCLDNGSGQIDVSRLAAGTYAIQLYRNEELYGEKLWVKD